MTLVVACVNRTYAAVITDRRYTVNGRLVDVDDDNRQKLIVVRSGPLRMVVGFAGLARAGQFQTASWLAERLHNALVPGGIDFPAFLRRASGDLASLRVPEHEKCVWILGAGFQQHGEKATPFYIRATNARVDSRGQLGSTDFIDELYSMDGDEPEASVAYAMGAIAAVRDRHTNSLLELLVRNRPPENTIARAVRVIRRLASDRDSAGLIGTECASAVVWADPERRPVLDYHPTRVVSTVPSPLLVSPRGVVEIQLEAQDGPGCVPVVHRRAPCPCRGGLRYQDCHRRKPRQLVTLRQVETT